MANPSERRITLWVVLGMVLATAVLVAILVPAIQAVRRAERRAAYANNMRQTILAILNFESTTDRLFRAGYRDKVGRPLCSWRFHAVDFMEAHMLGSDLGERWYDPENWRLAGRGVRPFCWWWTRQEPDPRKLDTNVVAITGPGSAFDGERTISLKDISPHTILLIEIANSGIHWAEPGDLDIRQVPESVTRGVEGDGVRVAFADGSVWYLRPDVPLDDLEKFFAIEDAKHYDREEVLGPYVIDRRDPYPYRK